VPLSDAGPRSVDAEGGTPNGALRPRSLADAGGMDGIPAGYRLRVWLEQDGVQPGWSVRGLGPTRISFVDESGQVLFTAALELVPILEELPNDADGDG
jgi:hypothetical protein